MTGYDIEIMADGEAVEFIPVTVEGRLTNVANGEADLSASAITHKREREQVIDFSQIYYADSQKLLVKRGSGINDLPDLDGNSQATAFLWRV